MLETERSKRNIPQKKEKSAKSAWNLVHRCDEEEQQGLGCPVQVEQHINETLTTVRYRHPASFDWMHYSTVACTQRAV